MGYILKNTSALINTKITDAARLKLAKGDFNIKYFQIGDSEVSYNVVLMLKIRRVILNLINKILNIRFMLMGVMVILMVYRFLMLRFLQYIIKLR